MKLPAIMMAFTLSSTVRAFQQLRLRPHAIWQLPLQHICSSQSQARARRGLRMDSEGYFVAQPFKVPKESAVPVLIPKDPNDNDLMEFRKLGLSSDVVEALKGMKISTPSTIQKLAIPQVNTKDNLVFAAPTGSGKTLSYLLPVIQSLRDQEAIEGFVRQEQRPRALILVPTRELAFQVLEVIKQISHSARVSSTAIMGGEDYGKQRKQLQNVVDIIVASPGRLLQHKEKGHFFTSKISHVVIDEVDTMLMQGFGPEIKKLLGMIRKDQTQFILCTATLTKAVRALIETDEYIPQVRAVETSDVHRTLPNLKHVMVDIKGRDKVNVLLDVLYQNKDKSTLIFCNTVNSCRAAEHSITEAGLKSLCYHGEINSLQRKLHLEMFKKGEVKFLVCSDIAARGLDMPDVDHVVMFDFPLNPVDYLHRSGRTARMGAKGTVTSILAKRDLVLANAIEAAVRRNLPLDTLTSSKRDYAQGGKNAAVVGKKTTTKKGNNHSRRNTEGADRQRGTRRNDEGRRQGNGSKGNSKRRK